MILTRLSIALVAAGVCGAAWAQDPGGADSPAAAGSAYLSQVLRRADLTPGVILFALAAAFGLGAVHALSPGHGKTLVAAYLVGARGTWRHAVLLGAMTTFTHTASVFALGFVTLYLAEFVAPEKLSPILGGIAGFTIVWIGASLLVTRLRRYLEWRRHEKAHAEGIPHAHLHDPDHVHGPGGHTHVPEGEVTLPSLLALGASGGLAPCPSALVLLLSAVYFQRVGLGLVLLVAFSAGLAAVLTGIGLLVLFAKRLLPESDASRRHPFFRLAPVLSAAVILGIGLLMTAVSLGVVKADRLAG